MSARRMSARRRRNLHLMADYGSAGVRDHDGAPLDPARLPLSPKLRARLVRWSNRFQQSFESEIDLDAFAAEGRAIARVAEAVWSGGRCMPG
jgi:hypothetical protein